MLLQHVTGGSRQTASGRSPGRVRLRVEDPAWWTGMRKQIHIRQLSQKPAFIPRRTSLPDTRHCPPSAKPPCPRFSPAMADNAPTAVPVTPRSRSTSALRALLSRDAPASTASLTAHTTVASPSADSGDFVVGRPATSPLAAGSLGPSPSPSRRRPKIDVRLLDYVSHCDNNLTCLICHAPFCRPTRLQCDHIFCRDCLRQSFDSRRLSVRTCPVCRSPVDFENSKPKTRSMPRLMLQMLDELVVRCPNHEAGCKAEAKRGDVQHHVDLYCDYTIVECPAEGCSLGIARKDRRKGCLHGSVACEDCSAIVMEKDLEGHQDNHCSKRMTTCKGCDVEVLRRGLDGHLQNSCPNTPASCPGQPYGCAFSSIRTAVDAHAEACPIAAMMPFLSAQKAAQEQQAAAQKQLERKVCLLESSFAAMQTLLDDTHAAAAPPAGPLDLPHPTLSPAQQPPEASAPAHAGADQAAPFDTPTHHLLSLHESLRDEFTALKTALADLDARTSVLVFNEGLRAKEETAHTNAAINSMRAQLHWLMSARLQQAQAQRARVAAPSSSSGGAGPSSGASGEGAGQVGGGGGGGGSGGMDSLGPGPVRRLSDEKRGDTKL